MSDNERNERHRKRAIKHKEVVDKAIARATDECGIILIHTGNGKGKSSSAFGMAARALGHEMKVGIVQFIKGSFSTGEESFFRRFPDEVEYHVMGDGFTWETQNREQDIATATRAWQQCEQMLSNAQFDLLIFDELNIVLKQKYLEVDTVINALKQRPEMQHVVITGRGAPENLIKIADTVTEMHEIKHAFKAGIKAQKGIEL